jgi:hypothetical protein
MSEAPQEQPVSNEQPASTEVVSEPQGLEDVFNEFKVEHQPVEQVQHVPQAQPQAPRAPEIHIPDPALDPEGFRRYEATRAAESQVLRQAVLQIHGQLSNQQQAAVKAKEEADIKVAVSALKEAAPGVKDRVLESYLGAAAREEPRLLQLWNNRDKNPQGWQAALKVLKNQVASEFQVKTDGQLVENVRAMKAAQSTMGTAQPQPSREETMGQLQGSAFDREWERVKSGG